MYELNPKTARVIKEHKNKGRENFENAFSDAVSEIKKLQIADIVLNGFLISLFGMTILAFFRENVFFSLIPTALYMIFMLRKDVMPLFVINKLSEKYPESYESLRTAYDNRDSDNFIARSLLDDGASKIETLESSRFFNSRNTAKKMVFIVVLLFVFLSINFINFTIYSMGFNPLDILDSIQGARDFIPISVLPEGKSTNKEWDRGNYSNDEEKERIGGSGGGKLPGFSKGPIPGVKSGAGDSPDKNILGKESSAKIEGEDVKMQIHPEYGGEIEIKDEAKKRKSREEFLMTMAKGAEIPSQEPLEYEDIIKRYFEKLLNEENLK